MELAGTYRFPATPEVVWDALTDPTILRACIPGCRSLTKTDDHRFDAVATIRIGPIKATFRAVVHQTDLDPPRRCVLKGEGQGGVAGFARGEAEVTLVKVDDATTISYLARANIGGKLARVGKRLIDGVAKQIADEFFARFAARLPVAPPAEDYDLTTPALPPLLPETAATPQVDSREGLAPEIWVIGLIGVIAILLVLFGVAL